MASKTLSFATLKKGASSELYSELCSSPLQLIKRINKMSKDAGKFPFVSALFERCGVPVGKLTFEYFAGYLHEWVEFDGVSSYDDSCNTLVSGGWVAGRGEIYNASAASCLHPSKNTPFIMHMKDTCVCASSRVVVRPWGDTGLMETLVIGTNPLPLSPAVWFDLMVVIGRKNETANKAALKLQRQRQRAAALADKEFSKRVAGFGVALADMPASVLDTIRLSVEKWAHAKVFGK